MKFEEAINNVKVIICDEEEEEMESFVIDEDIVVETEEYSLNDDYSEDLIKDFTENYIDYALEHCDAEFVKFKIKYSKELKSKYPDLRDTDWMNL